MTIGCPAIQSEEVAASEKQEYILNSTMKFLVKPPHKIYQKVRAFSGNI
jgi:hypothetical protein